LNQPLRALSKAAKAFGTGDLAARVKLARGDELGEVARAFDDMADRVTELFRAEKELLANVSHELRTPLARIRVALDIAAEGDGEAAKESLADITGDLDELERLITDTLTAAQLDLGSNVVRASGLPPLRREELDPASLLAQSIAKMRASHPKRELITEIADELPTIDGDPVLVRRAVDNLLENAEKYSDDLSTSIELHARTDDDGALEIAVVDHGMGISADDLPKVFRPFFRADKSRTRATGGLGLGLALTKRIVEAHGGSISLESTLGEGTQAKIVLPPKS
jgi:signal transduction histidine kinase